MREWVKSLEIGIEEIILFLIIVLNIFDAFEILPPDLDYVKKIISWSALAVMFVHARLDKVIAGIEEKRGANLLIIGFFLFTIKNLVGYARSIYPEASSFLRPFFTELLIYSAQIELFGLIAGSIIIAVACLRFSLKGIHRPSLAYALMHHPVHTKWKAFCLTLIFSLLFFIGIFNISMEWLAIAIDAPLLMIGLAIFAIRSIQQHKLKLQTKLLSTFGSFGVEWYEKIISELEYRRHLIEVTAVIVALHGVTDALVFLWPSIFGVSDVLYISQLASIPTSMWEFIFIQGDPFLSAGLLIVYLANIFTVGVIMLTPIFLWYEYKEKKVVHYKPQLLGVFLSAALITLVFPVFNFSLVASNGVYGVQFLLTSLQGKAFVLEGVTLIAGLGLLVSFAARKKKLQHLLQGGILAIFGVSYVIYILSYVSIIARYYVETINVLWGNFPGVAVLFSVFFAALLTIIVAGLYGFEKIIEYHLEIQHHHHKKRKTIRK